MKSICLITAAIFLTSMSSCSLLGSILKIPTGLLQAVGRTAGISGLTDEAASPIEESPLIEVPKERAESVSVGNQPTE